MGLRSKIKMEKSPLESEPKWHLGYPYVFGEYRAYTEWPLPSSDLLKWHVRLYRGNERGVFKEYFIDIQEYNRFFISKVDQEALAAGLKFIEDELMTSEITSKPILDLESELGAAALVLTDIDTAEQTVDGLVAA